MARYRIDKITNSKTQLDKINLDIKKLESLLDMYTFIKYNSINAIMLIGGTKSCRIEKEYIDLDKIADKLYKEIETLKASIVFLTIKNDVVLSIEEEKIIK